MDIHLAMVDIHHYPEKEHGPMETATIRDFLDEIRDRLDAIDGTAGDLGGEIEYKRHIAETGSFSHVIGETGAELLAEPDGTAYIDVSTVADDVIDLDDDTIYDLIEALRALRAFRAAQNS